MSLSEEVSLILVSKGADLLPIRRSHIPLITSFLCSPIVIVGLSSGHDLMRSLYLLG